MRAKPRVTIVEQFAYQGEFTLPFSQPPFTRELVSEDQPYQRVLTIGEEWCRIPQGWGDDERCGILLIANKPQQRNTYPTPEEAKEAVSAVVELAAGSVIFGEVPVGEDSRIMNPRHDIFARCVRGKAQVVVTAIPK